MPPASLCPSCTHVEEIVSARGSRFWLCTLGRDDPRWPKYPPQPVTACPQHHPRPAADHPTRHALRLSGDRLAICRLAPDAALPAWPAGDLVSVTRTTDELSIVCAEDAVPDDIVCDRDWRALHVEGPLGLDQVGVIAELGGVLAAAAVPVFVIATFDTDHLLVRATDLDRAIEALRGAGHTLRTP